MDIYMLQSCAKNVGKTQKEIMYHYKNGIRVAFDCERCGQVMPLKDKKLHQCNPVLVMKKIAEESEWRERRKNGGNSLCNR